jgi:hypothetical protein
MSNAGDDAAFAAASEAEFREQQYGPTGLSGGHIYSWERGAEWGRQYQAERDAATLARYRELLETFIEWDANYQSLPNGVNFLHWKRAIEDAKAALAEPAADGGGL